MGRRRETIPLPEPIIHRIQFLLTPKEAARTTVISKSWHSAWLTRPNLDLDETEFRETRRPNYNRYDYDSAEAMKDGFSEFAKKNIQRYVKSNLRIETFRLSLKLEPRTEWEAFSLSYELVLTALNLGAKHLDLKLNGSPGRKPFLPHEVLGAENLVGLCVEGYTINDLVLDQKVRCSKLEYLSLKHVNMNPGVVSKILSACPLIEKLSLTEISNFKGGCLKSTFYDALICSHKLTCLVLCNVKAVALFFSDDCLSSKFPSLKDLTLELFYLYNHNEAEKKLRVSIHSLERLQYVLRHGRQVAVEFDVPCIREFTFKNECSDVPQVFIETTSTEWESHVTMSRFYPNTSTFLGLSKFLTQLSQSKLYLSLKVDRLDAADYEMEYLQGLPCTFQVENLTIEIKYLMSLTSYALFDGLFRLCRPKCITQHLLTQHPLSAGRFRNEHVLTNVFLCKIIERGMKGHYSYPSNFFHGLHDLEEAYMQAPSDEAVGVWRLLTGEFCSDIPAFASPDSYGKKVRFLLKWKEA
ncbi:Unknown protein [Striga hermonthica]|uniref:F-box/LRR-repeat protein 15/At3g58940/PEG3-like LRR domain-containing protein n=1 Tax=Striga hermonthica TaxID=68872 RepID=A0A9N7R9S2_STRHE|nr:Unknown protein [Striga hermonthica]